VLARGSPTCQETSEGVALGTLPDTLPYAIATKRLQQRRAFQSSLGAKCRAKPGLKRDLV